LSLSLVILDGFDGSIITTDGYIHEMPLKNLALIDLLLHASRTKVLQDKYGVEFPWTPRTPLNIVLALLPRGPRLSLRKKLASWKQQLKTRLAKLLRGLLEGAGAPRRVVRMLYKEHDPQAALDL
jgi:hypothetical protein